MLQKPRGRLSESRGRSSSLIIRRRGYRRKNVHAREPLICTPVKYVLAERGRLKNVAFIARAAFKEAGAGKIDN